MNKNHPLSFLISSFMIMTFLPGIFQKNKSFHAHAIFDLNSIFGINYFESDNSSEKSNKYREYQNKIYLIQSKIKAVETLIDLQKLPLILLITIWNIIPDQVWLSTLENVEGNIIVMGNSLSLTSIAQFLSGLQSNGLFTNEKLLSAIKQIEEGRDIYKFKISFNFKDKNGQLEREVISHDSKNIQEDNSYIESQQREMIFLKEKWERILNTLPDKADLDLFVKSIESLAMESGLTVLKFNPKPIRKSDFYSEMPIDIDLSGTYYELVNFFQILSNEIRIINFNSFNLLSTPNSNYDTIKASLHTVIYYFLEKKDQNSMKLREQDIEHLIGKSDVKLIINRRDPFLPLVWKSQENPEKPRPKGFEGMTIAELQLIETWIGHEVGGNRAFFLGSDKKSYMLKVGDRCYNGKIVAIEENKVVFEMEIFDPFGNPKPPKVIIKYVHKPKEGEINE